MKHSSRCFLYLLFSKLYKQAVQMCLKIKPNWLLVWCDTVTLISGLQRGIFLGKLQLKDQNFRIPASTVKKKDNILPNLFNHYVRS